MKINKIYIASDHAGFLAKEKVKEILDKFGFSYEDLGTFSQEKSVDYPDFAKKVCLKVLGSEFDYGILICGSGTGMQIAANRFKGIRAAFCYDEYSSKMSRLDNDSNVITLRAREFDFNKYENILKTFFSTDFSNENRHLLRIEKLDKLN